MKALKNILLSIVVFVFAMGFTACEFKGKEYVPTDESLFEFTELADHTYSVGMKEWVEIPEVICLPKEHNGKAVTAISEKGFYKFGKIKEVRIPDNIETIGKMAFYGVKTLENVHFYRGVKVIEEGAFYGCTKLKNLKFASTTEVIGASAFASCTSLTEVNFTEKVTSVGENSFAFCTGIKKVYISHSVRSLAETAFSDCGAIEYEISGSNTHYKLVDGKPKKI